MIEKLQDQIEQVVKGLHKHGNKLDIHEKSIHLLEKNIQLLEQHRENHATEIVIIKGQQDHISEGMVKLSAALDKLTSKIGELFTLKNMVIGGFVTLTAFLSVAVYVLKLFMDYYKVGG